MANKPDEFPEFTHIDKNTIRQMTEKFYKYLGNLWAVLGINPAEIIIADEMFIKIIERVEMRRVYYHIFDNHTMDELSEGALLCYWVVRLHPFHHMNINSSVLNAKIAICLFVNVIYYYSGGKKRISETFINELYYYFVYREISEEALIFMANSFADKGS